MNIMNFFRKNKGSVSIFLCIILFPMVTYAAMIVDACRVQASKTSLSGAGDLAMNAAMANYEQTLQQLYGVFAMCQTEEELQKELKTYFTATIKNSFGVANVNQNGDYVEKTADMIVAMIFGSEEEYKNYDFDNLINFATVEENIPENTGSVMDTVRDKLNNTETASNYVKESSLANPIILKRQILDYMKYQGPVSAASTLLSKVGVFKDTSAQTEVVKQKVNYTTALSSVQDACNAAWTAINDYNNACNDFKNGIYKKNMKLRFNDAKNKYAVVTELLFAYLEKDSYQKLTLDMIKSAKNYNVKYDKSYENETDMVKKLEFLQAELNKIIDMSDGKTEFEKSFDNIKVDYDSENSTLKSINFENSNADTMFSNSAIAQNIAKITKISSIDKKADTADEIANWNSAISERLSLQQKIVDNCENMAKLEGNIDLYKKLSDTYNQVFNECNKNIEHFNENEKYKEFSDYNRCLSEVCHKLDSCYTVLLDTLMSHANDFEIYNTIANDFIKQAYNDIAEYSNALENLNSKALNVVNALNSVISKINEIDKAKSDWNTSISNVNDESMKSSMQSDYDTTTNTLKAEDAEKLKQVFQQRADIHKSDAATIESVTYGDTAKFKFAEGDGNTYNSNYYINNNAVTKNDKKDYNYYYNSPEFEINVSSIEQILGTVESENFYNVLKNICNPAKKQATEGEKEAIDNFNKQPTKEEKTSPKEEVTIDSSINEILKSINVESNNKSNSSNDSSAPNISKDYNKDSYNDKGKSATAGLEKAQELLKTLTGLATAIRDNVYVEEYITEMFTCDTDLKDKDSSFSTLSGYPMTPKNTAAYGKEIEFIIWGNSENMQANVTYTYSMIYLIRFALNAIYAFSSFQIQSIALQLATAIAGWTVVGVPVVQVVITIALALAESGIDIIKLGNGEDVPIFKNDATWSCSLTGMVKLAVTEATEKLVAYSDEVIDNLASAIEKNEENAIGNLNEYIEQLANQKIETMYSSLMSNIATPLVNSITPLIPYAGKDISKDKINEAVTNAFKVIKENKGNIPSAIAEPAYAYLDKKKQDIVDSIYKFLSISNENSNISDLISNQMKDLKDALKDKLNEYKNNIIADLKNELFDAQGKLVESAKGKIKNIITENMNKVGDNVSSYISENVGDIGSGVSGTTSSGGLTLNYKEYCKIFVLIELSAGNERNMIQRMATLMQANVNKNGNKNFKITNAYTMVKIDVNVKMNTIFPWAVKVNIDDDNQEINSDLENVWKNNGEQNSVNIKYSAVNGY